MTDPAATPGMIAKVARALGVSERAARAFLIRLGHQRWTTWRRYYFRAAGP